MNENLNGITHLLLIEPRMYGVVESDALKYCCALVIEMEQP